MPAVNVYIVDLYTGTTLFEPMAQGDNLLHIKKRIMIRHGGYPIEKIVLAKTGKRLLDNEVQLSELEKDGELVLHMLIE